MFGAITLKHGQQTEIARYLGVSNSRLSRWLSGHHQVPLEYVVQLSVLLGVPAKEIRPDLQHLNKSVLHLLQVSNDAAPISPADRVAPVTSR